MIQSGPSYAPPPCQTLCRALSSSQVVNQLSGQQVFFRQSIFAVLPGSNFQHWWPNLAATISHHPHSLLGQIWKHSTLNKEIGTDPPPAVCYSGGSEVFQQGKVSHIALCAEAY
ncbi:hypothetical protein VFPPC_18093 [Pochonia chlamydosporia 170]|uniref:Uncharacterized protein n=1 Tax=Pochonia chlamydosporia 170 TaxID=1380566 RepID=A0A219APB1_METCM|nr:hypothetical protein VFPPC_18093 [Pochonia chlamydosporia 170]OWT42680.1 hypothetical protein VFPPC_18093 [Pochonia chlamydosporia 170]